MIILHHVTTLPLATWPKHDDLRPTTKTPAGCLRPPYYSPPPNQLTICKPHRHQNSTLTFVASVSSCAQSWPQANIKLNFQPDYLNLSSPWQQPTHSSLSLAPAHCIMAQICNVVCTSLKLVLGALSCCCHSAAVLLGTHCKITVIAQQFSKN